MTKNQAQFTMHSLQRAKEIGLSVEELLNAWDRSSGYELPKKEFPWKFWKYGVEMTDDIYLRDNQSGILFTCVNKDKYSLIITITKIRGKHG